MQTQVDQHAIADLTAFCREELATAESYRVARHGRAVSQFRIELAQCEASHSERASMLSVRIAFLGGHPPSSEGLLRKIRTAAHQAVAAVDEHVTLTRLQASEQKLLEGYQTPSQDLDPDNRSFLTENLLPKQQQTYRVIDALKHALA